MTGDRALLSNVVEKAGPLVTFGDNNKGLSEGYGCLQAGNVIIVILYFVLDTCCTLHLELYSSNMCTSVLLVGKSKEEVNAPQFMDFAAADLLDYAISSSQSHFRSDSIVQGSLVDQLPLQVLGEDTDPKAICQWSVSTSPGLNPLDASADSGSDIGTADFWSYERSDTLVRMSVNTSGEKSETHVRSSKEWETKDDRNLSLRARDRLYLKHNEIHGEVEFSNFDDHILNDTLQYFDRTASS
ncbi:hypothetical protein AgCh_026617 [Apium graveolens]